MLCHKGATVVTIVLALYLSIHCTHAFGGRRKNIAHIFGKRANTIADINPWGRRRYSPLSDAIVDRPRTQGFDLDDLLQSDQDELEVVFPIEDNSILDWGDILDDVSQTRSSSRFADLIKDNETNNRKASNRQKQFNDYIFNRLSKYNK